MTAKIKFGTDGWRGVIAEDFTFENVAKVALATANFYKKHKNVKNGIVVGYDSRFLSGEFAEKVSEVLGNRGIKVILSDKISSTPMVSLLTKKLKAAAGIVITASHNPAKYNGFKIKGDFGGPAFPKDVAKVEKELTRVFRSKIVIRKSLNQLIEKGVVAKIDFTSRYIEDIRNKINIDLIQSAGIKIAYDAMHGAGQGVMDRILPLQVSLRGNYNPSFDGSHPEPLPQHTRGLIEAVVANGCDIGIATDGDADRIGAFDEKGNFVDSHRIFALLLKYFVEEKKLKGEVAKSLSVSQIIDKMCKKYGLVLHETPVGFKYLCSLMVERDILIAAEESGGVGIRMHLPERDGTYIGLLLAEIMAIRRKKLSELVEELMDEFGWHYFNRYDAHLTEKEKRRILGVYKKNPRRIAGFPVERIDTKDGFKLFVENGWVLVRASGTEPLIRFYAEAETPEKVEKLLKAAMEV
jgi:phosphomannomutase